MIYRRIFLIVFGALWLPLSSFNVLAEAPAKTESVIKAGVNSSQTKSSDITQVIKIDAGSLNDIQTLGAQLNAVGDSILKWFDREKFHILFLPAGLLLTLIVMAVFNWLFRHVLLKRMASRTDTVLDDMICESVRLPAAVLIFTIGFFLSAIMIFKSFPAGVFDIIVRGFIAAVILCVVWGMFRLVGVLDYFMKQLAQRTDNNMDDLLADLIRKALKITIGLIAIMFIGERVLGFNITALMAGAGVASLAVAFAAKDTIANFFGSVMIILDRPFTVGERVKISDVDGVVEGVGFRSTRLRSLDGHLFYVPNNKVADNTIENIGRRPFIKNMFNLTVTYDTSPEKVQRGVDILHELLDHHEGCNAEFPPKIFFTGFNDWSLNIKVIVWFNTTDWTQAQQWLHELNLQILARFNGEGIEFAFPSSTQYLTGDALRPLKIQTVPAESQ